MIGRKCLLLLLLVLPLASVTSVKADQDLKEQISLTFVVDRSYKVNLEGKIELTNTSGTNLSITTYQLFLPIIKLKNTKVSRITPDAFLVDSFRENNSNLFKLKASQLKPVILRSGAKVTFYFESELDEPYKTVGPLIVFDLPFQIDSPTRHTAITVDVDKSLPIVMSPESSQSEWNAYRFTLDDQSGKTFAFLKSDMTIVLQRNFDRTVNHVLLHDFKDNCAAHEFRSCENCGSGYIDANNNIAFGPKDTQKPMTFTSEYKLTQACLTERYLLQRNGSSSNDPASVSKSRIVGVVVYPDINTLIPTEWTQSFDTKTNLITYTNTELLDKSFPYALDHVGAFHIPIAKCDSDETCNSLKDEIANTSKTFTVAGQRERNIPQLLLPVASDFSVTSTSDGKYLLSIHNKGNEIGIIDSLTLNDNDLFNMNGLERRIVLPGNSSEFDLNIKSKVPVRNTPTELIFNLNGSEVKYIFTPTRNFLLDTIYILSIIFLVVLGIFLLSLSYLVVYNKRYAKKQITA